MKVEVKELHNNKWLSLYQISDEETGMNYVYSHETRCDGNIVAVLPFRFTVDGNKCPQVMLRKEVTPCWSLEPVISSVTGGVDNGSTPTETAVHEIEEECGYKISENDLIHLGTCYGTKSTSTVYHLFTVDLTDKELVPADGDGSYLEEIAETFWNTGIKVEDIRCPILSTLFLRLEALMEKCI